MNPLEIIYQNFPHCIESRDDSFSGILHEECRLDWDAYWKLEWALVKLTNEKSNYPQHLIWPIFRIFSLLMLKMKVHSDPMDSYEIQDFDSEQSRDFTERIQMVFEGFFKGTQPNFKLAFDMQNPLLEPLN